MKHLLMAIFAAFVTFTYAQSAGATMKIIYFSATGTTETAAKKLSTYVNAKLLRIEPGEPYTASDLDWTNKKSRTTIEMNDENSRPKIANKISVESCDTLFLGFPIWWDKAPHIINTFIESSDLSGKVVYVFATSGGSGISNSFNELKKQYPKINWQSAKLLNSFSKNDIESWIK